CRRSFLSPGIARRLFRSGFFPGDYGAGGGRGESLSPADRARSEECRGTQQLGLAALNVCRCELAQAGRGGRIGQESHCPCSRGEKVVEHAGRGLLPERQLESRRRRPIFPSQRAFRGVRTKKTAKVGFFRSEF